MIIKDDDAIKRLSSPMNLINQIKTSSLKRSSAMGLFGIGKKTVDIVTEQKIDKSKVKIDNPSDKISGFNPFQNKPKDKPSLLPVLQPLSEPAKETEVLENILEDHEAKIKLGLAHDKAITLLSDSLALLSTKLNDVKADKLPSVIAAASKTVESIRRERNEAAKGSKDRDVHFHFYTPEQKKISDYEVIDVSQ